MFGVPHPQWGEAVHAEVVLKPHQSATERELIDHCRQTIAGYKVPRQIVVRDQPLRKSAAGKILKRDLRARYWQGQDRTI